jgi:zinc transport system ATP-binding protein
MNPFANDTNNMNAPHYPALIQARQITHAFNGAALFSDINLTVYTGEYLTLIGLNGAGKSTLLRILLTLIQPNKGSIQTATNTRIGYVPQRWQPNSQLPMTGESLLELSNNKKNSKDKVAQLIETWQLNSFAKQQIHTLSGGQWQRLLLARALINDPQLLALDEPTQGLDLKSQHDFYQQIAQLHQQGTSILMVSHDLAHAMSYSQRVIALAEGGICCEGSPHTLMENIDYQQRFICAHNPICLHSH